MAVYLGLRCRCRDYFAVVIAEPKGRRKSRPANGRCAFCGYKIHWTLFPGYGSQLLKNSARFKAGHVKGRKVSGWRSINDKARSSCRAAMAWYVRQVIPLSKGRKRHSTINRISPKPCHPIAGDIAGSGNRAGH